MSEVAQLGPMAQTIQIKVSAALSPVHLEIINESYKHNVPMDSESHFKLLVVSAAFEGKSLIERQRLVNHALGAELKEGTIHALSFQCKTPDQFAADPSIATTPNCAGGAKK